MRQETMDEVSMMFHEIAIATDHVQGLILAAEAPLDRDIVAANAILHLVHAQAVLWAERLDTPGHKIPEGSTNVVGWVPPSDRTT